MKNLIACGVAAAIAVGAAALPLLRRCRILAFLSVLCAAFALPGATTDDFTVRCMIDISGVTADEPLYEVGPLRLAFRMAGRTETPS